ncbi:hypothetical protein BGZ61DRAFT_455576 [Ilyonectria robusta]|uniref:uncharacterized protein n=1 Tax=Ilyonectria robusta TaxID=1079257 RepID=UPI001E8EE8FE|nr:uncharacterized protein BGZ61DRAFT_455576 [Ilyonectria robusta]KAH8684056.1 hypothetical protein BGZ61DRAFT_455576 [Ilyonectria robusta]
MQLCLICQTPPSVACLGISISTSSPTMWRRRLVDVDPVTGSAGAAVLCTVLTQYLSSRRSEVCSEALGWTFLPILFTFTRPPDVHTIPKAIPSNNHTSSSTYKRSLWIVAAGIATSCLCRAEDNVVGYLPALTPLLLVAQKHLGSKLSASTASEAWFFSPLVDTIWGTGLAGCFATLTLLNWDLWGSALAIVPAVALLAVFITLLPRTSKSSRIIPLVDIQDAIVPLSLRVVVVLVVALCVQTFSFGFPKSYNAPTVLLGLSKALSWYFIMRTAQHASWYTVTAIVTFSITSTRNPFTYSSDTHALSHVVASFLALGQIIYMLPKHTKTRSALWALFLLPLVPYLANIYELSLEQSSAPSFNWSRQHPVDSLIQKAKIDFERLSQKQSQTYPEAYAEYRRRYNAEPPRGFEAWYVFASSHQSPIIDDFDVIYDAISPFWKLSGKDVRRIIHDARHAQGGELWHCAFSGDTAQTNCSHPQRSIDRNFEFLFNTLSKDLRGAIPDISFLLNHLDEPRVLIPPPALREGNHIKTQFNLTDMSHGPVWNAVTKFCPPQSNPSATKTKRKVETFGLPFITDLPSAMDLCQHRQYSHMHGLFISPSSFRLIEGLVPILSTGAPSTMGDILFPSPAYLEEGFKYDEAHDVDWDKKKNNLYWAGSTTGGFASDDQWRNFHRQRFVELGQNLGGQKHYYLRQRGHTINRVESSFLNGRSFDVVFSRIFACQTKYCREQKAYFNTKVWAHKDRALRSQLVFDLDGNGMSGRYYKLLASKSLPLKQTLFREWHDDRLVPWVHYIPISQGMKEVPELVFYLTSTVPGQRRAKEIAEQGREWFSKAFREVDMTIYTYRLLLELARLQDPERKAS